MVEDENKPKSIIIDGKIHNKFKILCKGKSLKIGGVIEDLIQLYLNDPRNLQKMIDEDKDHFKKIENNQKLHEAMSKTNK